MGLQMGLGFGGDSAAYICGGGATVATGQAGGPLASRGGLGRLPLLLLQSTGR
jgi:hypothetical protein